MNPFLAEVVIFAGNFAPRGWAFCDGQLLPISTNQALFSIIGTIYGGDGRTTFALPDLRGRAPIGPRNGPGLSSYREGQKGGTERNTLTIAQMPSHNHVASVDVKLALGAGPANENIANNQYLATAAANDMYTDAAPAALTAKGGISQVTVNNTGGNQSVENRQPYLAINYIIAIQGTFPSRS